MSKVRARARTIVMATVAALSVLAIVAFAVLSDGQPVRKVDLNDSGIWVTSNASGTIGRFNKSASSLDALFNPPGDGQATYDLDVLQDQGAVIARDLGGGQVTPVNVATGKTLPDAGTSVGPSSVVAMRGGTLAVLDPLTGEVRAMRYPPGEQLTSLQPIGLGAAPIATVDAPPEGTEQPETWSALTVGVDGGVHVVTRSGALVSIPAEGAALGKPQESTVAEQLGAVDVSAIGAVPVVLDESSGRVLVGGQEATVPSAEGVKRLQTPVASGSLAVATRSGLYAVSDEGVLASSPVAQVSGGDPTSPVVVGDCLWAAWAGSPGTVVKACGGGAATPVGIDRDGSLSRPVFRVNRGVAMLNDVSDGRVFDLDLLKSLDNWKEIRQPDLTPSDQQPQPAENLEDDKNKPKAVEDDLGARPGRTTILHVLDNDTDPSGQVLSLTAVTDPGNENATVAISPDGQSVRYTLSEGGGSSDFEYTVSNGVQTATGKVSVQARAEGENEPPHKRTGIAPSLVVATGATLPVQVVADWRDFDGDPVTLADLAPLDQGSAITTPDGRIEYTAPGTGDGGVVTVGYSASDGRADPVQDTFDVQVLPSDATTATAAVTQPDVVRGEAGKPVAITPLMNDIQGSDPINPKATLGMAAPVGAVAGVQVATDLATGQVVATPEKEGTFFLTYSAAFGSAPIANGTIRIDALAAGSSDPSPVAMPDYAAIHGQSAVVVDVLANDLDPAGSVLTVTAATAVDPTQVQVAVIKGRWLRIMPTTAQFAPNPQLVHYTVTNGVSGQATGEVSVTQLPMLASDPPVTRPDYGTVRAGDSVLLAVLDNDATRGGSPLSLLSNVPGQETIGQLSVIDPAAAAGSQDDVGTAYVSGDQVRYVAPAQVSMPRTIRIEYVTENDAGERGTGTAEVVVNPAPAAGFENRAPVPRPIDARALAGETITVDVPPSGSDPDGDSTSVVGIDSAPTLGRVLGTTPTGIRYQAYPESAGTESFSYVVTDQYGQSATSIVRVAITPPGPPQVAVAVQDTVTAAPGTKVTVVPMSNDLYGRTDPVRVRPLDQTNAEVPGGAALDSQTSTIALQTPAAADRPTEVSYGLVGNGGDSAMSKVVVRGVDGFRNPPRVYDTVAEPAGDGKTASVDLLKTAYDPDGDSRRLEITALSGTGASAQGGTVTVPMTDHVQAIAAEVTDESGATSAAVIYVPAAGVLGPFVKVGGLIKVPQGQSVKVALADYVADGQDKPVMLTELDKLWASPAANVQIAADDAHTFTVTGAADYVGPGAVTLTVTNGATLDDPEGITRVVTIPVQVGPETPVMHCPDAPIDLVAGGSVRTIDPMSICSVWTPTTEMAASLKFGAAWEQQVGEVSIGGSGGRTFTVDAAGGATPDATGTITLTAEGTQAKPATLHVRVVAAPPPTLAPITLPEMKQGDARTIDLRSYLTSPLRDAQPTAVSVTQVDGAVATATASGSTVTITPGGSSHGVMSFRVVASDVTDPSRTDRQVTGTLSFQVFGKPDAPGAPQPGSSTLSHTAQLSWNTPAANGAPIDSYQVRWAGGQQTCAASPCQITGLDNGTDLTFQVQAHNKADWSDWSPSSAPYRPDDAPQAVPNFRQTVADDGQVTLAWNAAVVDGSAIDNYLVSANGQQYNFGTALTGVVTGLSNGPSYTFTIVAINRVGPGPAATTTGQSAGPPIMTGGVTFGPVQAADADTTAVSVQWTPASQNGPSPATYTVTRNDGKAVCSNASATSCIDTGVSYGQTYTYSVTASTTFLGQTRTSAPLSASISPVGKPGGWGAITATPTGQDRTVRVDYSVPPSRGQSSNVTLFVSGAVAATFTAAPAGSPGQSRTISLPQNGADYSITAQVCNENGECSVSGGVNANAYGPIPAPTISLSKDGPTTFQVHVSGNGNGRQVNLHIWTDSGHSWDVSTTMAGSWDLGQYGVSYSQGDTAHITVSDTAGRGAPGQVNSNSQTADPPPPPPHVPSNQIWVSHSGGLAYIELRDWAPGSRVYCHVESVGSFVNWDVTWTVDGGGNRGPDTRGNQGNLNDPTVLIPNGQYMASDLCQQA